MQDFFELTPGVTWGQFTKAQSSFDIRGIAGGGGGGNSSQENGMVVAQDGIPITRAYMATPVPFDLQRVEIMRGPQGTTFGRNSTAGVVSYVSARPSQEFDSSINLHVGSLNLAGLNGFVTGGLSDTISARIAFNLMEQDGPLEDINTGQPLEGESNKALRGSLLIEPNDNFSAYLKAEISIDDDLPPARTASGCDVPWLSDADLQVGRNASPAYAAPLGGFTITCAQFDDWKSQQSPQPLGGFYTKREIYNLTAELTWLLDNDLTVTSLTGFVEGEHRNLQDNRGTPALIEEEYVDNFGHVLSTELRIDNTASGNALTWLAGVYLLTDEELRTEATFHCPERAGQVGCGQAAPLEPHWFNRTAKGSTDSLGLFGEISYDISERLNVTAGVRFTDDSRDYWIAADGWGNADELGFLGLGGPRHCGSNVVVGGGLYGGDVCGTAANPMGYDRADISDSWDNTSGKLSLTYAVNDNNNIYALFSQGFKSGGFQNDVLFTDFLYSELIQIEDVENFEIGWKGGYDRARFAVTLFTIEQTDAQTNILFAPPGVAQQFQIRSNLGGVEASGIEFEGEVLIGDNFTLGGNFASQDSKYGPGTLRRASFQPDGSIGGGQDISGLEADAPELTYVIYGMYEFTFGNGSSIRLRADVQHRDFTWGTNNPGIRGDTIPGSTQLAYINPEIDNIGASIRWISASGNMSVTLWGKNLGDDKDWKSGTGFIPGNTYWIDPASGVYNGARGVSGREQYGVDVGFRF